MPHDIAFSGGGFRALASSAVFAAAMGNAGLWHTARNAYGVSGGSWFLAMLSQSAFPHDLLAPKGPTGDRLEQVIACLVAAGVLRQPTEQEAAVAKHALGSYLEDSMADCQSAVSSMSSLIGIGTSSVAAKLGTKALQMLLETKVLPEIVRKFGSGASVAVAARPVDQWAAFLKTSVLQQKASPTAYPESFPKLYITAITPSHEGFYCVVELETTAAGVSEASQLLVPISAPQSHMSSAIMIAKSMDEPTRELLHSGGPLQVASLPVETTAAIAGSAFAFDVGHILREVAGIETFSPFSLLRNVTRSVDVSVQRGGRASKLTLELRDAGIDMNVPFLSGTGQHGRPAPEVLWVLDSGAHSALGDVVHRATALGHLPKYATSNSEIAELDKGEGTHWAVFTRVGGDESSWPIAAAPRVIVLFLGLTDDETMEPSDAARRTRELTQLYHNMASHIPFVRERISRAFAS